MKTLFNQLFGKHPSKKELPLDAWISDLAELDDLGALRFSTKQLAKIIADEHINTQQLNTQQLIDLIIRLEEDNATRLENLNLQFVNIEIIKPELELNISETCFDYCRQSYIFHLKLIEKVVNLNNLKLKNNLALLLVARALNSATQMLKWRMLVQANPPTKMWLQIFKLYRLSSQQGFLNQSVALFDKQSQPAKTQNLTDSVALLNSKNQTTLSAYFVQICMFGQLGNANMHKMHLDIASRLLSTWLTRADLSQRYLEKTHLFFIDCEKDAPAKRIRNVELNEHCRYWDLDDLEKQIAICINTSDRGEIPESLLNSKITNAKQLHETLTILYEQWTKLNYTRQRRKEPRHATSKTAKVNAGISNICDQVHHANQISSGLRVSRDGKTFDERLLLHTTLNSKNTFGSALAINSASLDVWIVTDESNHGIGTRVNKYANILARPNKLVALMMDETPTQVIIGIIRGVKPTHANQLKVGIEVISHHPTWVQLNLVSNNEAFLTTMTDTEAFNYSVKVDRSNDGRIDNKTDARIDMGAFSGIYIPIEAGLAKSSYLILPKINYQINSTYAISIAGVPKRAKLGEVIESRDDWVKVLFPF